VTSLEEVLAEDTFKNISERIVVPSALVLEKRMSERVLATHGLPKSLLNKLLNAGSASELYTAKTRLSLVAKQKAKRVSSLL
jgi:hypothetical protein